MQLHEQEDGGDDRAERELRDGARLDDHKELDEEELARDGGVLRHEAMAAARREHGVDAP